MAKALSDYHIYVEHLDLLKDNYQYFHRQIHDLDRQLRHGDAAGGWGARSQAETDSLLEQRAQASEALVEKRELWIHAMQEGKYYDERVSTRNGVEGVGGC